MQHDNEDCPGCTGEFPSHTVPLGTLYVFADAKGIKFGWHSAHPLGDEATLQLVGDERFFGIIVGFPGSTVEPLRDLAERADRTACDDN